MKKNKLILFDWGNIVESFEDNYSLKCAFDDLFKSLGSKEKNISDKLGKYELTKIRTMEELNDCYRIIKNDFKLEGTFNEFLEKYKYYFDKIYYYKDVRNYEISLKDKCYIGIVSNLLIIDKKRIEKQLGLSNYDYVFLSYKYGLKKPDIKFYEEIQKELPFNKEDILFIDDRENNVKTATKFGWNSVMLKGKELDKIKKVCEEFLSK